MGIKNRLRYSRYNSEQSVPAGSITAFCIFRGGSHVLWWFAMGFTVFSIASVAYKLKGKINVFPLLKSIAYIAIFVVLIIFKGVML